MVDTTSCALCRTNRMTSTAVNVMKRQAVKRKNANRWIQNLSSSPSTPSLTPPHNERSNGCTTSVAGQHFLQTPSSESSRERDPEGIPYSFVSRSVHTTDRKLIENNFSSTAAVPHKRGRDAEQIRRKSSKGRLVVFLGMGKESGKKWDLAEMEQRISAAGRE